MKIIHYQKGLILSPFLATSKRLKSQLIIILYAAIFSSCTKEIDLAFDKMESNLVINSIFSPDKYLYFSFSYDVEITHSFVNINDSIKVKLFENESIIIDTICLLGEFQTNYYPSTNSNYKVLIENKNGIIATSSDIIPELVYINEATIRYSAGVDKYGDEYAEAVITFSDPPNIKNYYEVLIYELYENKPEGYWISDGDTKIIDPVLLNEGDKDYLPTTYFFSDELFDGQEYSLRINSPGGIGNSTNKIVSLRSISKNYYLYRKYYTRHFYNQQIEGDFLDLVFKGEPQSMFSNIVNGYGIFAGYQETSKGLNIIE